MMKKAVKDNFYTTGRAGDIAMPPLEEITTPTTHQEAFKAPQEKHFPEPEMDQEVQPEEQVEQSQEVEQLQEVEEEVQPEEVVEQSVRYATKTKQENFRDIREAKEKAERERDILLQELSKRQAQYEPQQKQVAQIEEPDNELDLLLEDEALVEGKHAKKIVAAMKKMREEMRSNQNRTNQDSFESRLRNNFPDFAEVVSEENVAKLNQMHPELAQSLKDTNDMYTKASSAYKIMKTTGIYNPIMKEIMANKQTVAKNAAKPKPMASVSPQQGDSPLSKANAFANGLTPELKERLRKEMFESAKRS